jgi:signal transduction histidine kinase
MHWNASAELLAAFDEHDRGVRLRYSKVAHGLLIALVPAGASLDWFVYPHLARELLLVRLFVALLALAALGLHYTALARQNIRWLAMVCPLLVNAAISWMILRSEGAVSPYYAGLNLVLAGIGVLLPWSFAEASLACGLTLGLYFLACSLHHEFFSEVRAFFNNVYFLVLTSIICMTAAYFKTKSRFEEFRLSSELSRSYEQVRELERLKTEFFANVSHELRTPLTLILSPISDLMSQSRELPQDLQELVRLARDNSLRLLKLINDLLDVARLESDEFKMRAEPLELTQFVASQTETLRPLARLKNLTLALDTGDGDSWVTADPVHVEKIVVNLLINAIKFTPQGGAVAVRVRAEGSFAAVEVSDTGIGIPEAELPHIFDRFRQAGDSRTRQLSGVGIGLSLAKELAEKQGGSLSAGSRVGQGSIFVLRLPFSEARPENGSALPSREASRADDLLTQFSQDADRFVPARAAPEPPKARQATSQASVLVIDDEPDMRRYLASILSDRYNVREAADGEEGLELARQLRPELVLVDLMMPGVDGFEVCSMLKADAREEAPKVVVVTARTDEMAKITALKQGADDFISKPFSTLEVRTRVSNLCHAFALERSVREQNRQLRDALERLKAAEARLVQREKMRAVVRLAGGILHEIANPLNFTLTALGVAEDRYAQQDAQLKEILQDVRAGMLRIRDIVTDLRAFANPVPETSHECFDLGNLVELALRFTSGELAGVRIAHEIRQECPAYGSKSQLLQVLTNLLLNAAAAVRQVTDVREPSIFISAEARRSGTKVCVRDNGVGIPAELLSKVFDPFLTTRDVGQGMGLGLSICHTLVAAHGGEIRIQSEYGSWTEVVFELPAQQRGVAA